MVDWINGDSDKPNRFVCPNDRQLALRAKLKTGWSIKTGSLTGFSTPPTVNEPLGEKEQEAIVQVIQSAEKLEITDQIRIGKLVERLENMRRNALGRGPKQCLLCGANFGILGPKKVKCIDCQRWACYKCSIDADCSTKHHQLRDSWKLFGLSSAAAACHLSKLFPAKTNSQKNHYLCVICWETRDIWRKSGAWFYKSMPKYILPTTDPSSSSRMTRNRSLRMSCRYNNKEDESSSDDERRWGKKRHSSGATFRDPSMSSLTINISRHQSRSDSQISREIESIRNFMAASNLNSQQQKTMGDEFIGENKNEIDHPGFSRRESTVSRSATVAAATATSGASDWNWSDNEMKNDDFNSGRSNNYKNSTTGNDYKSTDKSMGLIELSLSYDRNSNFLYCTVYRARNLIPMDIGGLSDPFCKLNILPNAKVSTRLRTKTIHKTRNPEFNENLTFYDISEDDIMNKSLHILVVDDDKYGHDYMGEVRIKLANLLSENTVYLTVPLENRRPEQKGPLPAPELNQWFDFDLWSRGQILISLCYSTKKRALLVTVIKCANLLPMDNNGYSDPFVKLQLRPDPNHRKHKTSIKWKNLNPIFNEEFSFETRPNELYMQSLYITVFDKDYGKSNDYLGGLILGGSGSKGQRLKHWLDMIKYPDHRHEQWHNLNEDLLT